MTRSETILRCPECGTARNPEAAACGECGLLFISQPLKGRRKTDHKRAADALLKECSACRGENEANALRCRYCGEIIDERYRVARRKRLRSQINYASWVAYFLGVITLFIFKPVGVIAISAGLALSIAYYAIRVEEPEQDSSDSEGEPAGAGLIERMKRQFAPEKVVIRHPEFPGLRTAVMGTPLLLAAVGWLFNYSLVQAPANDALSSAARLANIEIDAHYGGWFDRDQLVLEFDGERAPTVSELRDSLVSIARGMKEERYETVLVRWNGEEHQIDGELFARIGRSSSEELPAILLELPEAVRPSPLPVPASRVTIPLPAG